MNHCIKWLFEIKKTAAPDDRLIFSRLVVRLKHRTSEGVSTMAQAGYVSCYMAGDRVGIPGSIIEQLGKDRVLETNQYGMLTTNAFGKLKSDITTFKAAGWIFRNEAIKRIGPQKFARREKKLFCLLLYGRLPFYFEPQLLAEKGKVTDVEIPNISHVKLGNGFATNATVISRQEAKALVQAGKALTIKDAAQKLGEKMPTVWRWCTETNAFKVFIIAGRKSKSRLIEAESLQEQLANPLFKQKRYSLTESAEAVRTSRQTIKQWVKADKLEQVTGPGGTPYILEREMRLAGHLSEEAQKHRHSKGHR